VKGRILLAILEIHRTLSNGGRHDDRHTEGHGPEGPRSQKIVIDKRFRGRRNMKNHTRETARRGRRELRRGGGANGKRGGDKNDLLRNHISESRGGAPQKKSVWAARSFKTT